MGISRDSRHKRRATGGCFPVHKKKRKYEMGRPAANTKLGTKRVRLVRCRGGNLKYRALRLDRGTFSWRMHNCSCKARVLDVVYNASNNELIRTKTLVKNAIVTVDAAPFRAWYEKHFGKKLGNRKVKADAEGEDKVEELKDNIKRQKRRAKMMTDARMEEQFGTGRLMACISSRPGQSGRCDGYLLEGDELNFYLRKIEKKKKK